ncbi:polysaccharide deacetylase family protein [Martelella sp. HB161492]|uniref:polysaccharide deacetylase family protein n=1 Tax=Martelella sp. HB161492 TaxID=2720726 RepID=UPI001AEE5C30|nr:polysaccharide deacetylase family protein [Martelella sp. HB161492]
MAKDNLALQDQLDTGQYRYAPMRGRPKLVWPNNARLAFWLAPNIEHYEWLPPINPNRNPFPRVNPDVLNYSVRDFGNRVGFRRLAKEMSKRNLRGSVSLSVSVCDHYPDIIRECNDLGWELFSHGIYNTRYFYGMTLEEQRQVVINSRETLAKVGQRLDGWLTPAITPSIETQEILAQEGVRYTLDYFHDDQPMPLDLKSGKLITVPYSIEMNDVPFVVWNNATPDEIFLSLKAQFDRLYAEGAESGRVMCFALHPFVFGQPHRIDALAEFLDYVKSHDQVWYPTAREIADWYYENHYDTMKAWLASLEGAF